MTGPMLRARRLVPSPGRAAFWAALLGLGGLLATALPACASKQAPRRQALMSAAREGDLPILWLLLEQGLDPNFRNQDGETPLHLAAWRGDPMMIRELLAAGADIDPRDKTDGRTPLGWAVFQGHREAAEALIDAGADIDHRERTGATLLMLAAARAPGLVGLLLDRGATAGADQAMNLLRRQQEHQQGATDIPRESGGPVAVPEALSD